MARKKKAEIVQALEQASRPRCSRCDAEATVRFGLELLPFCEPHYVAEATAQAIRSLAQQGLARRPDESPSDYRERMSAWFREKSRGAFKRVDDQPKENA